MSLLPPIEQSRKGPRWRVVGEKVILGALVLWLVAPQTYAIEMEDLMEDVLEGVRQETRQSIQQQVKQETREVIVEDIVAPQIVDATGK